MKKIHPLHLQKFYEMLDRVGKAFTLDRDQIKYVIEVEQKASFPDGNNMAIMNAVTSEISEICYPFLPVAAITSAPNHLSEYAEVLELKIFDPTKEEFIAWLSIFQSGRMIFGMNGVNLDSNGKKVAINEVRIQHDSKFFNEHDLIKSLRKAMVLAFDSKEDSAISAREKLLEILEKPLPDNN